MFEKIVLPLQLENRTIVRFCIDMKFTKEIILEEAFKLFLKKGYSEVSISVVQKELGIGRATLYYYFKNKEDLFYRSCINLCYSGFPHV